jgi:hypothetical protein
MIDRMSTPTSGEPSCDIGVMGKNTTTSVEPQQTGSAVDVAAAPGGTFQPLLTTPPSKDLFIDLGSTGRVGVLAWHL